MPKTRQFPPIFFASFSLLVFSLVACGGERIDASEPTSQPAPTADGGAPAPSGDDTALGDTAVAAGLAYQLPEGWTAEQPSSPMRQGQAVISGSGGDGQLAIFHFGPGGGGGVEANLQRWIGQMATDEQPVFAELEGDLKVTVVDLGGTLKRSTIGSFPQQDMPDYRLLGAVVEGAGGPWFFKAVGPNATMNEQRDAFFAMLEAAQIAP